MSGSEYYCMCFKCHSHGAGINKPECSLQLRLSPDQIQEKRTAESAVAEAKSELDEAEDGQREGPAAELASRQQKLDQLMVDFQVTQFWAVGWPGLTWPAAGHHSCLVGKSLAPQLSGAIWSSFVLSDRHSSRDSLRPPV